MVTTRADFWSGRTARARPFKSPPRELPRTERGGAAVLFAAPAGVHDHGRRCGRLARACRVRARLQRLDRRHAADLGGRLVRAGGPGCCSTRARGKRFREFREQPTPAARGRREHQDPRSRPTSACSSSWTSYVIVPPFALAKCGHRDRRRPLERAGDSPTAIGVHVGYVGGKPFGLVAAAGASAVVGFTVSLLVAPSTAHSSRRPRPASSPAPWARLPSRGWCSASSDGWQRRRIDALLGGAEPLLDLEFAVDPESDHIRGALDARVPWSSNSDVECPYGRRAEPEVRELLRDFPGIR